MCQILLDTYNILHLLLKGRINAFLKVKILFAFFNSFDLTEERMFPFMTLPEPTLPIRPLSH